MNFRSKQIKNQLMDLDDTLEPNTIIFIFTNNAED